MGKLRNDITGMRFGRLVAIKYLDNGKWQCKCDCGNPQLVTVKACNLKNGHTKSCGCIVKEQSAVNGKKGLMDLTNQRFGKLVAKKQVKKDGKTVWKCKCDCGNTCYISQNNLCRKENGTKSCGCNINLDAANKTNIVAGTNVGNIKSTKVSPTNTTTKIRGVCYIKSQGLYRAYITFRGKTYYLKSSKNLQECIKAREQAEKEIFGNFLEWYEDWIKKQKAEK